MHLRLASLAGLLLVAGAVLLAAPQALAGPGARARLRYQRLAGAESCPDQAAFEAEIAAWLGYDPFSNSSPREVSVELSGGPSGLTAHLQLVEAGGKILGQRTLQTASPDCRDLTQALVLAVALAVDPLPITRDVIAPAEPTPPPTPAVRAAPATPVAQPVRASGPKTEVTIDVGPLGVALGSPQFAPGLVAGVELRWDWLSVELDGEGDAFTGQSWQAGSVQVSLAAAELAPCYRTAIVGVCFPVVAAGVEMGHGQNIPDPSSQPLPYMGVGGRVLADFHLTGPLSLRLQVEGLGTVLGASFGVGHAGVYADVWDTPALTVQGAVLLALRL